MKKNSILQDSELWIRQACEEFGDEFMSEHFDYFTDYVKKSPQGLNLLSYAADILNKADMMRKRELALRKIVTFFPFIYLPLLASENLNFWSETYWNDLGKDFEPPSLYFYPAEKIFETISQEYKTPVQVPLQGYSIQALFRSYRTIEDIENEWEFSNGIYLFCNEDVTKKK